MVAGQGQVRRISIRPQARIELIEAAEWYEAQSEALGAAFLEAFDTALEHIARFEGILIVACIHAARDPREWQQR
jgi:hypothetical protein